MRLVLFLLMFSLFSSCTRRSNPDSDARVSETECKELELLFTEFDSFEVLLKKDKFEKEAVIAQGNRLVTDMNRHLTPKGSDCSFLNQKHRPYTDRFEFADELSTKIIQHKFREGLDLLIEVTKLFQEDPEILEFMSENLGKIALKAPKMYYSYLSDEMGRSSFLLDHTKWTSSNVSSIIAYTKEIEGSDQLFNLLRKKIESDTP